MKTKYLILLSLLYAGINIMAQKDKVTNLHHTRTSTLATTEPGIQRSYYFYEFRICKTEMAINLLSNYLYELANDLELNLSDKESAIKIFSNDQSSKNQYDLEGILRAKEGNIHAYYWRKPRLLTIGIHLHNKIIDQNKIAIITKKHFGLIESITTSLIPENIKAENKKIEVKTDHSFGRGVFAKKNIKKGEFIGGLYGIFHEAPDCMALPEKYRDHVMQCAANLWRGNEFKHEAVQYLNHSCEPNCGVQGLFDFVAMCDIKAGQELTTDYAMQDDSNWAVPEGKCLCGTVKCRGDILPYKDLTLEEKDSLKQYTSCWILHKYNICSCAQ